MCVEADRERQPDGGVGEGRLPAEAAACRRGGEGPAEGQRQPPQPPARSAAQGYTGAGDTAGEAEGGDSPEYQCSQR